MMCYHDYPYYFGSSGAHLSFGLVAAVVLSIFEYPLGNIVSLGSMVADIIIENTEPNLLARTSIKIVNYHVTNKVNSIYSPISQRVS